MFVVIQREAGTNVCIHSIQLKLFIMVSMTSRVKETVTLEWTQQEVSIDV